MYCNPKVMVKIQLGIILWVQQQQQQILWSQFVNIVTHSLYLFLFSAEDGIMRHDDFIQFDD